MRLLFQVKQFVNHVFGQLVRVVRCQIGQAAIFAPSPHQFVGVKFWSICRQRLGNDIRLFGHERFHNPAFAVNRTAIPQNGHGSTQCPLEFSKKFNGILTVHGVREEPKVQIRSAGFGTDRYTTDGRQPISPVPAVVHGLAASGSPGSAHRGSQHIARFIEKNQISVAVAGRLSNGWKDVLFPMRDGVFVPFARSAARLLGCPVQPRLGEFDRCGRDAS